MDAISFIEEIRAKEKLKDKEDFEYRGQTDEATVQEYENRLGVHFPKDYRNLVLKYGYVRITTEYITGISEDPYFNVLSKTEKCRKMRAKAGLSELPQNGIVLSNYAGGGEYVLVCDNIGIRDTVVLCVDSKRGKAVKAWPSFFSFLRDRMTSQRHLL